MTLNLVGRYNGRVYRNTRLPLLAWMRHGEGMWWLTLVWTRPPHWIKLCPNPWHKDLLPAEEDCEA